MFPIDNVIVLNYDAHPSAWLDTPFTNSLLHENSLRELAKKIFFSTWITKMLLLEVLEAIFTYDIDLLFYVVST